MKPKTIIILVLIILFLILLIQNTEVVDFKIYFWTISMSRIIIYPAILITGFIIGYIAAVISKKKNLKNENQDS
ncbi:MAG: LapA family protein [Candidatus Cloacimonetes bacterium]|nr:LapA family protein [Candidatus Cloacimonadota bacterium]